MIINLILSYMITMNKKKHNLYNEKKECCGCSACYAICPVNAIHMGEDDEGFLYPIINFDKCISCYKCLATCAFK